MLKYLISILSIFSVSSKNNILSKEVSIIQGSLLSASNNCISFSVGSGTGCAWMCNYCANQLGTNNYYFTTSICSYETGGCVGNPVAGATYTCCSA